jgi:hypothetical protein
MSIVDCKLIFIQTGKFTKALKKFEGILASILERFGENHHRVGAALHNVGIANLRAGKLTDAMDAIEEAVRIRKMTLGPDDPKVAVSGEIWTQYDMSEIGSFSHTPCVGYHIGFLGRTWHRTSLLEGILRLSRDLHGGIGTERG